MKAKPLLQRSTLWFVAFISLTLLAPTLQAARVVKGSLGHWISTEASPLLADILANHPRFKGEKIKVMAMQNGHPARITNALTEQVRAQLTDDLLTLADVKIVFDDVSRCHPIKVDTILGIDIERNTDRKNDQKYRVSLAFVDIDEGIWLNGTNISWVGRITNDQRKAYKSRPAYTNQVPVFRPTEFANISMALHDQLKCHETIATPIFLDPPKDELGRGVLRKFRKRITNRALITLDKSLAASIITLTSPDLSNSAGTLFLEVSDAKTPDQSMRIAEVKVSNTYKPAPQLNESPDLISDIHINQERSSRDVCKANKKGCVAVSFNLIQPAYTILFYTIHGKVTLLNCETPRRQLAGKYDYGLNVPDQDSESLPGLGFYALAFKDRKAARSLHRLMTENKSSCGPLISQRDDQQEKQNIKWLSSLDELLYQHKSRSDWTAVHLARDNNRLIQL